MVERDTVRSQAFLLPHYSGGPPACAALAGRRPNLGYGWDVDVACWSEVCRRAMSHRHEALTASSAEASALSSCGDWLGAIAGGTLHLISLVPPQRTLALVSGTASSVCFSPASAGPPMLLSGGDDKVVRLWNSLPLCGTGDTADAYPPSRTWTHGKKINCVAFSPDASMAVWSDAFGEVHAVSLRGEAAEGAAAEAAPALVLGHLSPISHMAFSACGGALLTADREGHVRLSLWPHAFVIEHYCLLHTTPLSLVLVLSRSPLVLTSAAEGGDICVWRARSGSLLARQAAATLLGQAAAGQAAGEDAAAAASIRAEASGGGCDASATQQSGSDVRRRREVASSQQSAVSVACACEVPRQSLVALAARGTSTVQFCAPSLTPEPASATLEPRPSLACDLSDTGAAIRALCHCDMLGELCVLLSNNTVVVIPTADTGASSSAPTRTPMRLPPRMPLEV